MSPVPSRNDVAHRNDAVPAQESDELVETVAPAMTEADCDDHDVDRVGERDGVGELGHRRRVDDDYVRLLFELIQDMLDPARFEHVDGTLVAC